jgi:hypothetical protein
MQQVALLFHKLMAHFAEIKQKTDPTGFTTDTHWVVERVIVADNNIPTSNGPLGENDKHVDGENWCKKFFNGGEWKQTSYNNSFRKKYAGTGDVYDPVNDIFRMKQPFSSWTLDSNSDWQPPVAFPGPFSGTKPAPNDNETYVLDPKWDEENQVWYIMDGEIEPDNDSEVKRTWNPDTSTWSS